MLHKIDAVRGLRGMRGVVRDFARSTAMLCETLPAALREFSIDLVVGDWVEPAAGLVARRLGIPYISVAAALPLNYEPGVPPPFFASAYGEGRLHRGRNMAVQWGSEALQAPLRGVIKSYAASWGLGSLARVEHCASGYAQIAQITPLLDYPRRSLIGCFHYCGPLRYPEKDEGAAGRDPTSRRAFASLGSLQGHRMDLFVRIADAAVSCGLDLTIAHGGRLTRNQVDGLSARGANVLEFVSYDEAFEGIGLAILHGGLNGVLDALKAGLPIVAIPLAFEQPAIGARVYRAGAGLVSNARASSARLARTINEVRYNPCFARAAAKLQAEFKIAGGVRRAADIVEQVSATGQPVLRAG
jgi:zeaxanthin glucosyltransferase